MWEKITSNTSLQDGEYIVGMFDVAGAFAAKNALYDSDDRAFYLTEEYDRRVIYPQFYFSAIEAPNNERLYSAKIKCINNGLRETYLVEYCKSEDDLFALLFVSVGNVGIIDKHDIEIDMLKKTKQPKVTKIKTGQ